MLEYYKNKVDIAEYLKTKDPEPDNKNIAQNLF